MGVEEAVSVRLEKVLSITHQRELLDLTKSTYYYLTVHVSDWKPELMSLIDQRYLNLPF